MPLIMDEAMDVDMDDLFGDGTDIPIPAQPLPRELVERIDEMRTTGACQRLAWSKNGSLASISQDSSTLEFRALRCTPQDGSWRLSRPTIMTPFRSNLDGGPLRHISWSTNGSDLAVIDAAGRVSIMSITFLLNRPDLKRDCRTETTDDLHAVVGTHWLSLMVHPPNRPSISHGPAVKNSSGKYIYEASQMPTLGPCYPSSHKAAFLCITTNGLLRLFWHTNSWYEQSIELESITSSDELITHAAVCPDKNNTLLIAFATTTKQLRIIRAAINWNVPQNDKTAGHGPITLNPTVQTRHVAVTNWLADTHSNNSDSLPEGMSLDQITSLEFLPPSPDTSGKATPPTILITRTQVPLPTSLNQETRTIIDRWEVSEANQALHPAFEQLGRKNSTGGNQQTQNAVTLKKLEPFSINKILLNVERIILGKYLFMGFSDGSVQYRNRRTMAEMSTEGNAQKFHHLSQVNFGYLEEAPCLQIITSPSFCSAAHIALDGKVRWRPLEHLLGDLGTSSTSEAYYAALGGSAMTCVTSVISQVNFDDVLATIHRYVTPAFATEWLVEVTKILKIPVDYSEEVHHDLLVRNPLIQVLLGMQLSLGYRGDFDRPFFSSKLAGVALQLRNVVVVLTMAANMKLPAGPNAQPLIPLDDPNIITSLVGPIRWCIDLIHWITDSLLEIAHKHVNNTPAAFSPDQVQALSNSLNSENSIALHLILASSTRGFLIALSRRIAHIGYIASKAEAVSRVSTQSNKPNELYQAYTAISTQMRNLHIPVPKFEKLLTDVSSAIKKAYGVHPKLAVPVQSAASKTDIPALSNPRTTIELMVMIGGNIPQLFAPALAALFNSILPNLRSEINPEQLFFRDYSLLKLADNEAELRQRRKKSLVCIDALRKVEIDVITNPLPRRGIDKNKGKLGEKDAENEPIKDIGNFRRCTRCAGVMENLFAGNNRMMVQWMVQHQKKCNCGGPWLGMQETPEGVKDA